MLQTLGRLFSLEKKYEDDRKDTLIAVEPEPVVDGEDEHAEVNDFCVETARTE